MTHVLKLNEFPVEVELTPKETKEFDLVDGFKELSVNSNSNRLEYTVSGKGRPSDTQRNSKKYEIVATNFESIEFLNNSENVIKFFIYRSSRILLDKLGYPITEFGNSFIDPSGKIETLIQEYGFKKISEDLNVDGLGTLQFHNMEFDKSIYIYIDFNESKEKIISYTIQP